MPEYLKAVIHWLKARLTSRRTVPCGRLTDIQDRSRPLFRIDAKADGNDVGIGGWQPYLDEHGAPDTQRSRWFATRLTPTTAPWAYVKGEPFKTVAALELLATVVALMVFAPSNQDHSQGIIAVTGHTDSMVSSMVVGKGMTTAFPLNLIAMEAAAQMEALGVDLTLRWLPRDMNAEADDLSNFRFSSFAHEHRVEVDLAHLPFLVLPHLSAALMDFHTTQVSGPPHTGSRRKRARPDQRLRITQPW